MIMKLVNKIIDKIGVDKILHFVLGGWIVQVFCTAGCWQYGILFALFLSIVKEMLDKKESRYDWIDIAAAMAGGIVAVILSVIIKWMQL